MWPDLWGIAGQYTDLGALGGRSSKMACVQRSRGPLSGFDVDAAAVGLEPARGEIRAKGFCRRARWVESSVARYDSEWSRCGEGDLGETDWPTKTPPPTTRHHPKSHLLSPLK